MKSTRMRTAAINADCWQGGLVLPAVVDILGKAQESIQMDGRTIIKNRCTAEFAKGLMLDGLDDAQVCISPSVHQWIE
jgi:hypothetical protein